METTAVATIVFIYYAILFFVSEICVISERRYENDDE